MSDNNPFLALGEAQVSAPVKSRIKGAETRRANKTAAEKKLEETDQLTKLYLKLRREHVNAMLEGPFGFDVRQVKAFLRQMEPGDANNLISFITRQSPWIKSMPKDHQFTLLRMISNGIVRVREKAGMEPYDDGLPGDPPKAFEQIKTILGLS